LLSLAPSRGSARQRGRGRRDHKDRAMAGRGGADGARIGAGCHSASGIRKCYSVEQFFGRRTSQREYVMTDEASSAGGKPPGTKGRRNTPTIDLKATELKSEQAQNVRSVDSSGAEDLRAQQTEQTPP